MDTDANWADILGTASSKHYSLVLILTKGYDWRGPSSLSAFDALSTLRHLVPVHGLPAIPQNSKVVLFGHSNGGQGVWHNAARWPDEVAAGKIAL